MALATVEHELCRTVAERVEGLSQPHGRIELQVQRGDGLVTVAPHRPGQCRERRAARQQAGHVLRGDRQHDVAVCACVGARGDADPCVADVERGHPACAPHRATAFGDAGGGGHRQKRTEIAPRQHEIAVGATSAERVAQYVDEDLRAGLVRWRIECGNAQRMPQ